jgi:hypothetical protein
MHQCTEGRFGTPNFFLLFDDSVKHGIAINA